MQKSVDDIFSCQYFWLLVNKWFGDSRHLYFDDPFIVVRKNEAGQVLRVPSHYQKLNDN
jgi:hypothetical protein